MQKHYYIYILTNKTNRVFYIGVTSDLRKRLYEHQQGIYKGFSAKYHVDKLVYLEIFSDPKSAIAREKQLKNWHREWKINLIRQKNNTFKDLAEQYKFWQ